MSTSASFLLPAYVAPPVAPPVPGAFSLLLPAALALLPPGRAFSRRLDSLLARVVDGLCLEPERVHAELVELRVNLAPRRARRLDYIEAWEEAVGVEAPVGTLAERAEAVVAKLRAEPPDRTLAGYQAAASARGMTLTRLAQDVLPFRVGTSAAGDPVPGDGWAFVFDAELAGGSKANRASLRAAYAALSRAHTLVRVEDPPGLPVPLLMPSGAALVDGQGRQVIRG
jgi:uncharacterized protein YmfQ (DUF2313 family)